MGTHGLDVFRAVQNSKGQFVGNTSLSRVNSNLDDRPRGISTDGCRLYLVTSQSGHGDLRMAERPK